MQGSHWHESKVEPTLFLKLQDLTHILSQMVSMTCEFSYGSFIDINKQKVTVSSRWDSTPHETKVAGYKTDIYLRTIGTLYYSNLHDIQKLKVFLENTAAKQFTIQLFTLLEDIRLEDIIKQKRPGTKRNFANRQAYMQLFFEHQRMTAITKGLALDELYCMIYLTLFSNRPDIHFPQANVAQLKVLNQIKSNLYDVFDAKSSADIMDITITVVTSITLNDTDLKNKYFVFPIFKWEQTMFRENSLFDELTRTDDLANKDSENVNPENKDYIDETFSTWHRENKNKKQKETFLQMDLDVGTKTNLKGGTARETESGDQAFASAQGKSTKSKQNDYSERTTLEKHDQDQAGSKSIAPYGDENIHARKHDIYATQPTATDIFKYQQFVNEIEPFKRKLAQTIEKIIEYKKTSPRNHLHFGRLSKNLIPLIIDGNTRVFYKKDLDSNELDTAFTLMVDCSASMYKKMDETKRGIVLFHELLKYLKIPHSIVGFWEAVTTLQSDEQPNYFHHIHSFEDSFYENNGAKIMQLEPEEDNRDGYSIRIMTEQLMQRREKHKILLIFSDGEPAAAQYNQNGIADTYLAVTEARKKGINVIGMFLSDEEISQYEDEVMKNIYGRGRLMIPNVTELPEYFSPLLKKLLMNAI